MTGSHEFGNVTPTQSEDHCPLCDAVNVEPFHEDKNRVYFQCPVCELVFVPECQLLAPEEEKKRYDLHENEADDNGYRRFLNRLFEPLSERLAPGSHGLDFGSGPGPVLSAMFEEAGHIMTLYDPFFADNQSALENSYDFITATEVFEHLHNPGKDLDHLWSCLKPGGSLGVMTKLVIDRDAFSSWHYIRDLTHVRFFSRGTFQWLAEKWNAELTFIGNDVMLLQKAV